MLNRKQLPLIAKVNNLQVSVDEILDHCKINDLLNPAKYTDIQYSAKSKHQNFLISNEFCKTNFFTEKEAPLMEGEKYKQLYLTDFDETKSSNKVNLHSTNIFERTKRLSKDNPKYLPEADELNYGIRNNLVKGPFEKILNLFKSKLTRVRLAYLTSNFSIKPHVDYDPSYITRYHLPLITNNNVYTCFEKNNKIFKFNLPSDGYIYFFNSGIKHWVENNSEFDRLHLIIDTHGQDDLTDITEILPI